MLNVSSRRSYEREVLGMKRSYVQSFILSLLQAALLAPGATGQESKTKPSPRKHPLRHQITFFGPAPAIRRLFNRADF